MLGMWKRTFRAFIAPAPVICLAIGFGCGALAMMPLGLRVTDAVAGVMGAIVGALAGVASALALVHYQGFVQARNVAEIIQASLNRVTMSVNSFEKRWLSGTNPSSLERTAEDWGKLQWACESLIGSVDDARERLKVVEPIIPGLHSSMVLTFGHVIDMLEWVKSQLETTVQVAKNGGKAGVIEGNYLGLLHGYIQIFRSATEGIAVQYGVSRPTTLCVEDFTFRKAAS